MLPASSRQFSSTRSILLILLVLLTHPINVFREYNLNLHIYAAFNLKARIQQKNFPANERNKTRLIQLQTQKVAAEGIETRVTTGDADIYIVRCALEKAISHTIVAITWQDVNLVVLLIALAPTETNIYFMKPGKRKVEAKLFSTRKLQKELSFPPSHPPSPCIQWLRHNISYL
ncbi:hypothetical protein AVEN_270266-1 [Araneus ventricosus]|uniref:Uncharacterized protein n=1 Tax=Araneus ventricosus TaxID=182803 RepID=A0A4Y2MMA5_ARAVE|nr:hypothetical protein AVEN_270266-1 [Araneus ventricosus]